jgi:hypothetical protein
LERVDILQHVTFRSLLPVTDGFLEELKGDIAAAVKSIFEETLTAVMENFSPSGNCSGCRWIRNGT